MDDAIKLLSAGLEFFFAVLSALLLVGCLCDHDRKRPANRVLIAILVVNTLMNVADAFVWLWCDAPETLPLVKALCFLSYALGCAIFAMFSFLLVCYIREREWISNRVPLWTAAFSAFMAMMWVLSMFNGMYVYWDENGAYQQGDLYFLSQLFGAAILVCNIALVISRRKALGRKDCAILVLYSAIPLFSFAFVPLWEVVPLYMATTLSLFLLYVAGHVAYGRQVAEQQARLARQELALSGDRTAMMLSQIQPHFLYNSLTAIAQLCKSDPERARQTTLDFSAYLRANMRSLSQKTPIPFETELEHVKTYLSIEQVRYGDKLRVVYDIETTDFHIPSLCLEPLVENAVKHGVSAREEGGTVVISAVERDDCFEVVVSDDGVGFVVGQLPDDSKAHIGLANVRERLFLMMNATLAVESRSGIGTDAAIRIPKRR